MKLGELRLDGSRDMRVEGFDNLPRLVVIDLEEGSDLMCEVSPKLANRYGRRGLTRRTLRLDGRFAG